MMREIFTSGKQVEYSVKNKKPVMMTGNCGLLLELMDENYSTINLVSVAELNHQNSHGMNSLHYICENADKIPTAHEIVQELIKKEMDVNLVNTSNETALAIACKTSFSTRHKNIVRSLLNYDKTDVNKGNLTNGSHFNPNKAPIAHLIYNSESLEMFKVLVNCKRVDVNIKIFGNKIQTLLMHLCSKNLLIDHIKVLLTRQDLDLDITYYTKYDIWNALILASNYSKKEHRKCKDCYYVEYESCDDIVELLINDKRCNINSMFKFRDITISILMNCLNNTHTCSLNTIKLLIEKTNIKLASPENGNTALHYACLNKFHEIIALFTNKVNNNINNDGNTVLHLACYQNDIESVKLLLNTCNVDLKNNKGDTPLHIAALENNHQIIRVLLKQCRVNLKNKMGNTPIMLCAKNCPLVDSDSDSESDNKKCKCKYNTHSEKSLSLLLAHNKIDVYARDKQNKTVIDNACKHSKQIIRNYLLDRLLSRSKGHSSINHSQFL